MNGPGANLVLKWNSDGWLLVEVGAGKWKMGVSIAKMPINAATHLFLRSSTMLFLDFKYGTLSENLRCVFCRKRPRADLNRDRWIQSPEC